MLLVEVIKQSGETGLRRPGSQFRLEDVKAIRLQQTGLVKIVDEIKTKELKTSQPKPRGKKTVIETKANK